MPASPAVKAYESDIVQGALQDYIAKSKELGGPVAEHASSDHHLKWEQKAEIFCPRNTG